MEQPGQILSAPGLILASREMFHVAGIHVGSMSLRDPGGCQPASRMHALRGMDARCEGRDSRRVDQGYEHLSPFDRPLRDVDCPDPATLTIRYGRCRWTLTLCARHAARNLNAGAKPARRRP